MDAKWLSSIYTKYMEGKILPEGMINDHDERCVCYKRIVKKYPTVNKRRDKEVY